ncbi:MAG: N-acetylmuramoyl-L-alanine amidase family protein, partial [Clostridia bacterium]
ASYVYRLVIDPGHGGNDGGNDQGEVKESVLNLEIALKLRNALREKAPEIQVIMTREDDTYVSLEERAKLANELQADFFISIHCNSFQDDTSV